MTFLGGAEGEPVEILVNNRGATREALIRSLELAGKTFVVRSDWHDKPTSAQVEAARKLSRVLKAVFPLKDLGGHTEYAMKLGDDRSCPGTFGLQIAAQLRQEIGLSEP